ATALRTVMCRDRLCLTIKACRPSPYKALQAPFPKLTPTAQSLVGRHLDHLRVQRRLAERTLVVYEEALCRRLLPQCEAAKLALHEVRPHHVRGWTARLHAQGLGPRSIALTLSAWR